MAETSAFAEPWASDDLPSSEEVREAIRAVEGDDVVVDRLGLVDSFQLRVPTATPLTRLLDTLLAEGASGKGWLRSGERWLGGAEEVELELARLGAQDPVEALKQELIVHVDGARLRFALDELAEQHPTLPPEALEYRDVWPSADFRCQIGLRLWRGDSFGQHRLRLGVGLWTGPLASGPPDDDGQVASDGSDQSLASSLEHLVEFQRLYGELHLLALFFEDADADMRLVFGVPWLPVRSVIVIPRVTDVPSPRDYIDGSLAHLTQGTARVLFEKADVRAASVSASQLQGTALCLHRQFSGVSSERVYSSYLYVPVTDDIEQFEADALALIASFETIEGEVAEELWDVSSDLEMVETQFEVQHRLTTEASEIIDALVAHLLDGSLACPAPFWHVGRRRAYRESRNGLRDAVELTRRTLVQTEGERAEALAMVREAKAKTDDVRAFVRTQADQILTRVSVDGFPTVTDSLLSSEKFGQAERHIAGRSAESADDARLARLLETTTNVFVEERERTLEVVERQASVLNLALGVVALFTIIEFLVDVRVDGMSDMWVNIWRGVAATAGASVLLVLAALWIRTRSERKAGVRPTMPELHGDAVSAMRLLRAHTASDRAAFEMDKDLVISARIAQLFNELANLDRMCAALRRAYIERLLGNDVDGFDEATVRSVVSAPFADFLIGQVDGPAWAAAADLDLLRLEASAWSLRTILLGERPSRMYLSWLPLTTALYYVHDGGQSVSNFELLNQVGEGIFTELVSYGRQDDRSSATEDRMQLAGLIYTTEDPRDEMSDDQEGAVPAPAPFDGSDGR